MKKRERLILAIDTAGSPNQVLLLGREKELLVQKSWSEPYSQSKKTLIIIDQILKQGGYKLKDLALIVINRGPTAASGKNASFTGLKIGATIGNTLSLVLNIPVNGISLKSRSLERAIKETSFSNKKKGFVSLIYPKPPNINISKIKS